MDEHHGRREQDHQQGRPRQDESVLNNQPDLGTVGTARSSGGMGAVGAIRREMTVVESDGSFVGIVEAVEGDRIRLKSTGSESDDRYLPITLVDGVDDERVILSRRGDAYFGLGAQP